jgi:alpha-tubulin suppressor-like RCC1 family protein
MSSRLLPVHLALLLSACTTAGGGSVIDDSLDGASPAGKCGDGMIDEGEDCDDENENPRDECTNQCTAPTCGDGVMQGDEQCDDGDDDDANSCTSSCTVGPAAVAAIATGDDHTCAVSTKGAVRCWGAPGYGRLGQPGYDETIGDDEPPSDWDPVAAGDDVIAIAAGTQHTCVLRSTGTVLCWGYNSYGQLGLGHTMSIGDDEPVLSGGDLPLEDLIAIASGDGHNCALDGDGAVWCWGSNSSGQLGTGDTTSLGDDETLEALAPVDLPGVAVEIVAGSEHSCARLDDGKISCWGRAAEGQLGYGTPDAIGDDESPASAGTVDLGGVAIDIDTEHDHTCAVLEGGTVRCWGNNSSGQLGYGDTKNVGDRKTPAEIGDVMLDDDIAVAIETGSGFTCALLDDGDVRCWGTSSGIGVEDLYGDQYVPQARTKIGGPVRTLSAGADYDCVILDSAAMRCWGSNTGAVLGYPDVDEYTNVASAADHGDVSVF